MEQINKLNQLNQQITTLLAGYSINSENNLQNLLINKLKTNLLNFQNKISTLIKEKNENKLIDAEFDIRYKEILQQEKLITNVEELRDIITNVHQLIFEPIYSISYYSSNTNSNTKKEKFVKTNQIESIAKIGNSIFKDLNELITKISDQDPVTLELGSFKSEIDDINHALCITHNAIAAVNCARKRNQDKTNKIILDKTEKAVFNEFLGYLTDRETNTTAAKIFIVGATILGFFGFFGVGAFVTYFAASALVNAGLFNHSTERDIAQHEFLDAVIRRRIPSF